MAIAGLELEFEEESSKQDALDLDIDLSFSASPEDDASDEVTGVRVRSSSTKSTTFSPVSTLTIIGEKKEHESEGASNILNLQSDQKLRAGSDKSQVLKLKIQELNAQIKLIEGKANAKIELANAQRDYLVEYISNAKVMDHKVTQILLRINSKVPALKKEVQMVKKIVTDFINKDKSKK